LNACVAFEVFFAQFYNIANEKIEDLQRFSVLILSMRKTDGVKNERSVVRRNRKFGQSFWPPINEK